MKSITNAWLIFGLCFAVLVSFQLKAETQCSKSFAELHKTPKAISKRVYEEFEIKTEYPPEVIAQAKSLVKKGISSKQLSGRMDYSRTPFVTIDGIETIDRDDAIFVERKRNGNYILRVAVPHMAAFIERHSPLEKWIFEQSTSNYLRDNVFHMLPPFLVSGLLSIDPGKKRLAMVYSLEYSLKDKDFISFSAERAVVKSKEAITYTQFQEKMESEDLQLKHEKHAIDLFNLLVANRKPGVKFPFETEKKAEFDEQGRLIKFDKSEKVEANYFIEVFMVSINSMGADYMAKKNIPGMFRLQEDTDSAKVKVLFETIDRLGFRTPYNEDLSPLINLQAGLNKLKNYEYPEVILPLLYYVTKPAENTSYPGPHSFLQVEKYAFFTSPLRRVADYWNQIMIGFDIDNKIESPEVLELLRVQDKVIGTDNDNMKSAKRAETKWQSIMELGLNDIQKGFGYQGIIARSFEDFDLVYFPEKKVYAEVEKLSTKRPKHPFAQTGKRVFVQIMEIDYEAGTVFGDYR